MITDQEKVKSRLFLTSTMELKNRDFRVVIYYDLKRGLIYHESHKNFVERLGPLPQENVSKWFREFEFGRSHFNDDNRCGRLVSAATQENTTHVKELIREDIQITCKDLQDILGTGITALDEIPRHQLGVHKRCARWVPHQLIEEQKVDRG